MFKVRLLKILRPVVTIEVSEWNKLPSGHAHIEQMGGSAKVIDDLIEVIANGMYNALHNGTQSEPYITSFCTADNYEIQQHGLLSQWRGYGQDGGYAIVLDTSRLVSLLKQEYSKWGYALTGADVVYSSDPDERFHKELGDDINNISSSISEFLKTNSVQYLDSIYDPFVRCACRYKHWGFHEEKEVRIIAILHARGVL